MNTSFQQLSKYLETRKRHNKVINLESTYRKLEDKGVKMTPDEYESFWKAMEHAGVGSIIIGRNGNPNRFQMKYTLKDVVHSVAETGNAPVTTPNVAAPLIKRRRKQRKARNVTKRGRKPTFVSIKQTDLKGIVAVLKNLVNELSDKVA